MPGQTTNLDSLSISTNAQSLSIPSLSISNITGDLTAEVHMPAHTLYELFRFTTDSSSFSDANAASDTLARLVAPTWDVSNSDTPDITSAKIISGNAVYGIDTSDTIGTAFIKKSAYKQFSTHLAVDLFNNLKVVADGLTTSTELAWQTQLTSFDSWYFDKNGYKYNSAKELQSGSSNAGNPAFNIFSYYVICNKHD